MWVPAPISSGTEPYYKSYQVTNATINKTPKERNCSSWADIREECMYIHSK
jgi:hypothetical protein